MSNEPEYWRMPGQGGTLMATPLGKDTPDGMVAIVAADEDGKEVRVYMKPHQARYLADMVIDACKEVERKHAA